MLTLRRSTVPLLLASLLGISTARADDPPSSLINQLTPAGITPTASYNGDAADNLSGGHRRGAIYNSTLHIQLAFDLDQLAGMPGLSGYLDGLWINGGQPSKRVGDVQNVSNLGAPGALRLYEGWLQYNTPDKRASLLAGRYDLNTEFYHLLSAGILLNGSFGIGAELAFSGFGDPSIYPDTSVGARAAFKPTPNSIVRAAVLDAAPLDRIHDSPAPFNPHNGALLIAEATLLAPQATADPATGQTFAVGRVATPTPYDSKISVGAWYYTGDFNTFSATGPNGPYSRHHGEGGGYLLLDRLLYQPAARPDLRLSGFIQLGFAQPIVSRVATYLGAGLALNDFLPDRTSDQLSIGMAMARNGSNFLSAERRAGANFYAAETALELTYLAQVKSWLTMQPDLQYVIHPSAEANLRNATVAQLRFVMTY